MYLAIDVGGTKTLLAVFNARGEIIYKYKFATSRSYKAFIASLKKITEAELKKYKVTNCCCAVPGKVDRERGVARYFGNLGWQNVPIKNDLYKILGVPILIENDGNLAGLSEALLLQKRYKKVLYITISTGIGDGIIINGKIDETFADSEPGHMVLENNGKMMKWEEFASGDSLVKRYGKRAEDINDPKIWLQFAKDVAKGLDDLVAIAQPQVVVVGGGVGTHFNKYGALLNEQLRKFKNDMVDIPPVIRAKRPEEAVVYGCYDFIKQCS